MSSAITSRRRRACVGLGWFSIDNKQPRRYLMSDSTQHYYTIRRHQDGSLGEYDTENIHMLYLFQNRHDAMTASRRAAHERNEYYYGHYEPTPIQEKQNGWQQRGETSHYLFEVEVMEVEQHQSTTNDGHSVNPWVWGVVILQRGSGRNTIHSLFVNRTQAMERFDKVLQELKEEGPSELITDLNPGDILTTMSGEPSHNLVKKESYLVSQINADFDGESEYEDYFDNDELREYIEEWSPKLDSIVQLVKIPVLRQPLSESKSLTWVKDLMDPDVKYFVESNWSEEERAEVLAKYDKWIAEKSDQV